MLFLVPSIALLSQTLRERSIEAEASLRTFAVCSDAHVGGKKPRGEASEDDNEAAGRWLGAGYSYDRILDGDDFHVNVIA